MTRETRSAKVQTATAALPALLVTALHSDSPQDWDAVERQGAIIHRQSRLLSGKPRGG